MQTLMQTIAAGAKDQTDCTFAAFWKVAVNILKLSTVLFSKCFMVDENCGGECEMRIGTI